MTHGTDGIIRIPPGCSGAERAVYQGSDLGESTRPRRRLVTRRLPRALARLTALALTGMVGVALAGPASAAASTTAADGGARRAPSVDGVSVGWLPGGVSLTNVQQSTRIGSPVIVGTFQGGDTTVQLTVQRSTPDATPAQVAAAYAQYYPASRLGRITLRGTEAVTLRPEGSTQFNELTWVEGRPAVVLTVAGYRDGKGGAPTSLFPEADLLHIATSLSVGPAPKPTAWQTLSQRLIRAAFPAGLDATSAPPRVPLAHVENGQRLVSLLEKFRATYPGLAAKVTVNQVYVWSNDHASVTFTIAYSYQGQSGSIGTAGKAVFTQGTWKVSEATYRSVLALAGQLGNQPA